MKTSTVVMMLAGGVGFAVFSLFFMLMRAEQVNTELAAKNYEKRRAAAERVRQETAVTTDHQMAPTANDNPFEPAPVDMDMIKSIFDNSLSIAQSQSIKPVKNQEVFSFVDKNGVRVSKKNGMMVTELPDGEILYLPDEI